MQLSYYGCKVVRGPGCGVEGVYSSQGRPWKNGKPVPPLSTGVASRGRVLEYNC